ncbi:hypothetical protein NMG60_11009582 [Bertholletia excelsa]
MGGQVRTNSCYHLLQPLPLQSSSSWCRIPSLSSKIANGKIEIRRSKLISVNRFLGLSFIDGGRRRGGSRIIASSSSDVAAPMSWDDWQPDKGSKSPPLSDVVWPAAGAFLAMALLGKMDQLLAPKGLSFTIAPFGAVCAVLFATPSAPAARKYSMFMAQIGSALSGVLAFSIFGPGWLARGAGLAAALAFMISTRAIHPPAASLPLLFIDGVKLHRLNFWYAIFPGAAGCVLLCLIQEVVCYLKENFKF